MHKHFLAIAITATLAGGLAVTGCSHNTSAPNAVTTQISNPLLAPSTLQYQAPDFSQIKDEHFKPALEQGIAENYQEILAIANNPAAPTFDNTIVAMEKSGALLTRASSVFYNLVGSNSNPELLKIQGEMAPKMAQHSDNINLNPALFARIDAIYNNRANLGLTPEQQRLVEVYHQRFILAGAKLTDEQKLKIRALNEEQSKLTNEFSQRLLRLTKEIAIVVDSKSELAGLTESEITSAANDAKAAGHEGKYLINITNTTRQPVLAS
ncbi:MAG: dipeptidyl carboxypeptidase II, partial [Shewanella sp.]